MEISSTNFTDKLCAKFTPHDNPETVARPARLQLLSEFGALTTAAPLVGDPLVRREVLSAVDLGRDGNGRQAGQAEPAENPGRSRHEFGLGPQARVEVDRYWHRIGRHGILALHG
jgi:hypothetical protein